MFAGRFAHRNFIAIFGDRTFPSKGLCNRTREIAIPSVIDVCTGGALQIGHDWTIDFLVQEFDSS